MITRLVHPLTKVQYIYTIIMILTFSQLYIFYECKVKRRWDRYYEKKIESKMTEHNNLYKHATTDKIIILTYCIIINTLSSYFNILVIITAFSQFHLLQ